MKLSESPSKLIGLHLGEATINTMRPDLPPLKAKFALFSKEGEPVGYMEMTHGWSEKALEALRVFQAVLEEEAVPRIFEQPSSSPEETPKSEERNEPPQF